MANLLASNENISLPDMVSILSSGGSWHFSLGGGGAKFKKLGVVENTFGSHTRKSDIRKFYLQIVKHVTFSKKQIIWLQLEYFLIFREVQPEMLLTCKDLQ